MIISGKNSVFEALNSGTTINKVLIDNLQKGEFVSKVLDICQKRKIRYDFVDKKRLDKLSMHNQGIVADITDYKYCEVDKILNNKSEKGNFIVILDRIQDPHNFGSIIRVCECAGVDGIIIEDRRSCVVNETVYKTSAGAINHVKIAMVKNINLVIKELKEKNIWVYAAEGSGKRIYDCDLTGNIAIVMGSEGEGVSRLTKSLCDEVISLPMFGKVNSLNVSTATSAIIYEALRQREGY